MSLSDKIVTFTKYDGVKINGDISTENVKKSVQELIGKLNNSKLRIINNDKLTEEEQLLVQTITTAWKESFNIIIQEVFGEELV